MPFGLCNMLATFQWLMQNCLGELNLIYCLIYLDDLIMLCSLFKEEINYLAHQVSKQGVQPTDANLKAIVECVPLQTYMEIGAFLGLVGHYRQFIEGFSQIAQPLNEHLAGEGASRKSE